MSVTDPYLKKTIIYAHNELKLEFQVAQDLFSSHQVDTGSQRLLRTLLISKIAQVEIEKFHQILDLGCGYGPLGLALKKSAAGSKVHMVDRDALAVAFAHSNARLNRLPGVDVYGSLGFDDVSERHFDLIVSNIPGKAGEPILAHLLTEAQHYLRSGGRVAIVVVTPLEEVVGRILTNNEHIHILFQRAWPGHTVFHYEFTGLNEPLPLPQRSGLERGVYTRSKTAVNIAGLAYSFEGAHNLPEFDTPGHGSRLLMEGIAGLAQKPVARALIFNGGPGHVAVAMWRRLKPEHLDLVDRDRLALHYSKRNLLLAGCPADGISLFHEVDIRAAELPQADLITGELQEESGAEVIELIVIHALKLLRRDGTFLLVGSSTAVTRVVDFLKSKGVAKIESRKRHKGRSLLVMNK
jgi:16S rRNA (guanine1207-N2)-methyltransferase